MNHLNPPSRSDGLTDDLDPSHVSISDPLRSIHVILVETSHTGNIGSVARAMKTMGLSQLTLVNPKTAPDEQSIALAAGATDVIERIHQVDTFDEAIAECDLVIGASARQRRLAWPHLNAEQCGDTVIEATQQGRRVALVFGRERIGLTNDELQKCHYHVSIDANPEYGSLNLAMSVQILAYTIYQAFLKHQTQCQVVPESPILYPKAGDLEQFYTHLETILRQTHFIRADQPGQIMGRLRRLVNRSHLDQQELLILRGILSAISKSLIK